MKKQKQFFVVLFVSIVLIAGLSGCYTDVSNKNQPITITVWHVYGGQTDSPLNDSIERFNQTIGKEKGINVQVTSVSNTNTIHELVLAAANEEPGAPALPDLFISYPKTVMALPDDEILVDYRDYFSREALEAFVPAFLEEGTIDGRLVVLPVAKSTEMMFINKTAFDRFSKATGVTVEDLSTWEGLFKAARLYAEWTDEQTPDIAGDAKSMFVHDYYFNYFQVGAQSMGEAFFEDEKIVFGPAFKKMWYALADAALSGGVWLNGGYATDAIRTGDGIVSVASSASILYYSDIVTYADNTTEEIEIIVRPCPVFEDGAHLVMQRGAGFCTVHSTPEREKAAMVFLKWLTSPTENVDFVMKAGYMPVTTAAFEQVLPDALKQLNTAKYRSLYESFMEMQKNYEFYVPPQMENYLSLETLLEEQVRAQLALGRKEYIDCGEKEDKIALSESRLQALIALLK